MDLLKRSVLITVLTVTLCACGALSKRVFTEKGMPELSETVNIAPLSMALTFARIKTGQARHIIAVTRFHNKTVAGVNLTQLMKQQFDDPIDAYLSIGYDGLVDLIQKSSSQLVTIESDQLIIPVDLMDEHIAAGTNYSAHAGETSLKGGPFLFPKHVVPTAHNSEVIIKKGLIDYEVELAAVTLRPVQEGILPNEYGLILTNDFTDRATLLRHIDVSDVASGKGFTTGKSFPGFLPVGNLFVIPKNPENFSRSITLKLYVNNQLRQRSTTDKMIWDFKTIVKNIGSKKDVTWAFNGESISLAGDSSVIAARTLILSGTPQGVIFQGIPLQTKLSGIASWIMGGWNASIPQNVIEAYICEAEKSKLYLKQGDRVTIHTDTLGLIDNQIESD